MEIFFPSTYFIYGVLCLYLGGWGWVRTTKYMWNQWIKRWWINISLSPWWLRDYCRQWSPNFFWMSTPISKKIFECASAIYVYLSTIYVHYWSSNISFMHPNGLACTAAGVHTPHIGAGHSSWGLLIYSPQIHLQNICCLLLNQVKTLLMKSKGQRTASK